LGEQYAQAGVGKLRRDCEWRCAQI